MDIVCLSNKTIEDAKGLLFNVKEIDLKKVKLLCLTLKSKGSELKSLDRDRDRDIFDLKDESKIGGKYQEDVSLQRLSKNVLWN